MAKKAQLAGTVKGGDTAEAKVDDEKADEEVPDIECVKYIKKHIKHNSPGELLAGLIL
jgi:hypothetical protein